MISSENIQLHDELQAFPAHHSSASCTPEMKIQGDRIGVDALISKRELLTVAQLADELIRKRPNSQLGRATTSRPIPTA